MRRLVPTGPDSTVSRILPHPAKLFPCVVAVLLTAACGSSTGSDDPEALGGDLTVLASASLTETFTELGEQFETANPSAHVRFSFGAGSTLATQIVQGAPADVFASASVNHMDTVVEAGKAGRSVVFASNMLTVAVPAGNPAHVTSLEDLADPKVTVAVCVPKAPCGRLAARVFKNAGIAVTPVTQEVDVKATLNKVVLGEVDAGLVYVTDVKAAGRKVEGIAIPEKVNASTTYPIGVIEGSSHSRLAQAFVDHVLSEEGKAVLTRAGFSPPEGSGSASPTPDNSSGDPTTGTTNVPSNGRGTTSSPRRAPGLPSRRRQGAALRARGRTRRSAPRSQTAQTPAVLSLCACLAVGFLLLPLIALLTNAPWGDLPRILSEPGTLDALQLSFLTATAATGTSVLLGVPLAWVLARSPRRGTGLLRALVTLPLVLPPVVGGVALLMALGRTGLLGRHLDSWFHITFPFTTPGVVLAETFVAMPFLVVTVEGALRSVDRSAEEAAATLGASRLTVLRRITLPLVAPSLLAGGILCWTRALGEFGATITFAGNFPGTTQTMPLSVYLALENDPDAAVALSVVLLGACLTSLLLLRNHWLRPRTSTVL
ncbi:MAG: molybdate transport system permease protein [Actinomycetota bacterium]|nr:molybdate transport system permease protein [Actinomycetota bacterium]